MSEQDSQGSGVMSPVRGLTGLIAANVSLIVAIMVYMGWAYEQAFYAHFHLASLDLDISIEDYLLYSLHLFNPVIVFAAVAVIGAVTATRDAVVARASMRAIRQVATRLGAVPWPKRLHWQIPQRLRKRLANMRRLCRRQVLLGALGTAMTVTALALYRIADYFPVSTYLVLVLFASGPLLLTWALRGNRQGRALYALAIVISVVCALWAGSLYANGLGTRAAQDFTAGLATETEVAVYSAQQLALSGPGVTVQKLPAGFAYRYRYEGLRLLYMNSGTYYLLPSQWIPQLGLTYILDQSDQIRVEFY